MWDLPLARGLESGMQLSEGDVGKSDGGSAFLVILAEIAIRSPGDPLIGLLIFFWDSRRAATFMHLDRKTLNTGDTEEHRVRTFNGSLGNLPRLCTTRFSFV